MSTQRGRAGGRAGAPDGVEQNPGGADAHEADVCRRVAVDVGVRLEDLSGAVLRGPRELGPRKVSTPEGASKSTPYTHTIYIYI